MGTFRLRAGLRRDSSDSVVVRAGVFALEIGEDVEDSKADDTPKDGAPPPLCSPDVEPEIGHGPGVGFVDGDTLDAPLESTHVFLEAAVAEALVKPRFFLASARACSSGARAAAHRRRRCCPSGAASACTAACAWRWCLRITGFHHAWCERLPPPIVNLCSLSTASSQQHSSQRQQPIWGHYLILVAREEEQE